MPRSVWADTVSVTVADTTRRLNFAAADCDPPRGTRIPRWGEHVGEREVRTLPTVWRCVELLTHTVTQLPVTQRRGGQQVPLVTWIRRPESYGGGYRLRELVMHAMTSLTTSGAAYWYATPAGDRSWVLAPIAPSRVSATLDRYGMRTWRLDGEDVPPCNGAARRRGLLTAAYLMMPDEALPLGPLQAARRRAAQAWVDVDDYATNVFRGGMKPGQHLKTEQDLPPETLRRYQRAWMDAHADPANPTIPVLGGGLDLGTAVLDPKTAQWLESRTFNAQEIARLFGIPARMLGLPAGDSVTYATARDNDAEYLRYAVMGWVDAIEDAWSSLLPPGRNPDEDERVHFDLDALLRPTTVDLWRAVTEAAGPGWMSPEEARRYAGMTGPAPTREEAPDASGVPQPVRG